MTLFKIRERGRALAAVALAGLSVWGPGGHVHADQLHERIDAAVLAGNVINVAGGVSDEEFLRRLYLDLTGGLPPIGEVRAFLGDQDPEKKAKLLDTLLESRQFSRHLAVTFDLWLMERRPDKHVTTAEWRKYLTESFAANKPYDQLAREILGADGSAEKIRPASRFYLDRLAEPHLLTRDVGRLFFGKDLQCAQCHDHPNISDFLQREYYGLFAFYGRSALFQPDTKKPALLSEKADGEASFQSVFTDVKATAPPRLPGGEDLRDPVIEAGKEYRVKPNPKDKNVRPVPAFSRREQLGKAAADGSNLAFNRNIVNRLWSHMMGRGLVEPADLHHPANAAAHPELLDLLADEFVNMKFDVRAFLRELALTDSYARTFELTPRSGDTAGSQLGVLEAEAASLKEEAKAASAGFREARKTWEAAQKQLQVASEGLAAARKQRDEAVAARKKAEEPLVKARAALAEQEAKLKPLSEAAAKAAEASQALPDDQELGAAAMKIRQRSESFAAEVEKARGELRGKEESMAGLVSKVEAAAKALGKSQQLADDERAKVKVVEEALVAAQERFRSSTTAERMAQRRVGDAQSFMVYSDTRAQAVGAAEKAGILSAELGGLENTTAEKQKLAENLREAARRATEARGGLPGDTELAGAVEILRKREADAASQSAAATSRLAAHRDQLEAIRTETALLNDKEVRGREELSARASASFALGVFAPLTPEQLCASTLQATGEWEHLRKAVEAEFEKKLAESSKPGGPEAKEGEKKPDTKDQPPLTESDRARYLEEQMDARLKSSYATFIKLFGGPSGQPQSEFFATADQALFLENNGLVRGWLRPKGNNLTARLARIEDPSLLAEELYLGTVIRFPSEEEKSKVRNYLATREKDRPLAIQELAWALISSVEFRFKH